MLVQAILHISIFSASLLLGASGHSGDGELVFVSSVVPSNVEVTVSGFKALIKLEVSVVNVVALAFGGLEGSVVPVALAFKLIGDTGLLDLALV